jgi:hypothetical protein
VQKTFLLRTDEVDSVVVDEVLSLEELDVLKRVSLWIRLNENHTVMLVDDVFRVSSYNFKNVPWLLKMRK